LWNKNGKARIFHIKEKHDIENLLLPVDSCLFLTLSTLLLYSDDKERLARLCKKWTIIISNYFYCIFSARPFALIKIESRKISAGVWCRYGWMGKL
jgi:hypothetical protein